MSMSAVTKMSTDTNHVLSSSETADTSTADTDTAATATTVDANATIRITIDVRVTQTGLQAPGLKAYQHSSSGSLEAYSNHIVNIARDLKFPWALAAVVNGNATYR